MTEGTGQATPGWYPDPHDADQQRYWDGIGWTAATAPLTPDWAEISPPNPVGDRVVHRVYGQLTGSWGFGDVGWFVLCVVGVIAASVVLVLPVYVVAPEAFTPERTVDTSTAAGSWVITIGQMVFYGGLVAWPLIVGWRKARGWREAFGFVVSWRALGIGLVGGIVTLVVMAFLTDLTARLLDRDITSAGADAAESLAGSTPAFVVFLLLIALGAPFVEEIAFRGLVWGAVVKHGWSPWWATVIAGVPFALLHVEPLRVVPLLAAGLVLGVIRQYSGLSGAMLAHCVVNTIGAIGILAAR